MQAKLKLTETRKMTLAEADTFVDALLVDGGDHRGSYGRQCGYGTTVWGHSYVPSGGDGIIYLDYTQDHRNGDVIFVTMFRYN